MAEKPKSRRRLQKDILARFEETYDLEAFKFRRRLQPLMASALLRAALTAIAFYSIGFGMGYFSWLRAMINDTVFMKLVWILMIPSTVAALMVWLIMKNRLEFPVRQELNERIRTIEGEDGMLWRYGPIMAQLAANDLDTKSLIMASRQGDFAAMAPDDYCPAVLRIHETLSGAGEQSLRLDTAAEVAENLENAISTETGQGA